MRFRKSTPSRKITLIFGVVMLCLSGILMGIGSGVAKLEARDSIRLAYASPSASFTPVWIAKTQGIFEKNGLDVNIILIQGASVYMPALFKDEIQVLYGGGTAVSREVARGDRGVVIIGTETVYIPLRMMVHPKIQSVADLKGKKIAVGPAGLDEYATLLLLNRYGISPSDVTLIYYTGGIPARAAAMQQGLFDAMAINPPNEHQLEKLGFRQLVNFMDLRMPYAGVPYTVMRSYLDTHRDTLNRVMLSVVQSIRIFMEKPEVAKAVIGKLTRESDREILGRTYQDYRKQYQAIEGKPFPFVEGLNAMISGFHMRFTPQLVKVKDSAPFTDRSFVDYAVSVVYSGR
ncbi:MAG TPA: ABC transporter substrate-binding protein [bacterium]|nr:ABC transporter substrate-binding protein [bacterium]